MKLPQNGPLGSRQTFAGSNRSSGNGCTALVPEQINRQYSSSESLLEKRQAMPTTAIADVVAAASALFRLLLMQGVGQDDDRSGKLDPNSVSSGVPSDPMLLSSGYLGGIGLCFNIERGRNESVPTVLISIFCQPIAAIVALTV